MPAETSKPTDPTQTMATLASASGSAGLSRDFGATVAVGERVGPYTVRGEIGRGGMGIVYRAFDETLDREVALKIIPPGVACDAVKRARFLREARSAAQLQHPGIVPVYLAGEHGSLVYLAMAYIEGQTLAQRMRAPAGVCVDEALRIVREVAEALQHAHDKGIVHRDIKPENIMLDREGRVQVMDFGLARSIVVPAEEPITDSGLYLGTPVYSSPEQVKAKPLDARSDLYSLGVVLYELVTGRRPFQAGASAYETFHAILHADVPLAHEVDPGVPRPVSRLIAWMMARDPAGRPTNGASVAAMCDEVRAAIGDSAAGVRPSGRAEAARRPAAQPGPGRLAPPPSLVATMVLALLAAGLLLFAAPPSAAGPGPRDGTRDAPGGAAGREPGAAVDDGRASRPPSAEPAPRRALAVLFRPFEGRQNIQSLAWLQVGIPMMLQSALAEAEGLDVVPEERARAMAQRLGLGDLDDLQHMHQLVAQLPIDVAVTGFYFLAGEQLRIDATVWDVASGQAHGSVRVTGPEAEIFAMLDDLTARLRAKLDALAAPEPAATVDADSATAGATASAPASDGSRVRLQPRLVCDEVEEAYLHELARQTHQRIRRRMQREFAQPGAAVPGRVQGLPAGAAPGPQADGADVGTRLERLRQRTADNEALRALTELLIEARRDRQRWGGVQDDHLETPLGYVHFAPYADLALGSSTVPRPGVVPDVLSAIQQSLASLARMHQRRAAAAAGGEAARESEEVHRLAYAVRYAMIAADYLQQAKRNRDAGDTRQMAIALQQSLIHAVRSVLAEPRFRPAHDVLVRLNDEDWTPARDHEREREYEYEYE